MPRKLESELERQFYNHWNMLYPNKRPALQYRFHPTRRFRFDFAWPMEKIAVEVQGMHPGHTQLPGITNDFDKLLEALLLNWKVVYLTSTHLTNRRIDTVCEKIGILLKEPVNTPFGVKGYIPYRKRRK